MLLAAFMISFGCQKETTSPAPTTATENMVWRTPDGYLIPYSERDNWKEYVKTNLSQEKIDERKRYKSQGCVSNGNTCAFECVETRDRYGDCIKVEPCAPCANCGCTKTS